MNAYQYSVSFFDEEKMDIVTEKGIVCGESYGRAIDNVVGFYGDNIDSITLSERVDRDFPVFPEDELTLTLS